MTDPINLIAHWLRNLLAGWGLASGLVDFIMTLLGVVVVAVFVLLVDIFLVWVERKVVARFQDRLGPNRLGPFGLIQPIADVIKLLIKEDITPAGADKVVYNIAPILALATVLVLWAVIPFSSTMLGADLNVGILFFVAAGSIGTLGIIMAGWASNNKYALLGAFRTVAQVVSYEVPMVISLLVPVILARSMAIGDIVKGQSVWYIVMAPVAAFIFLTSAIAELGRAPFDLIEAESEIVAGFHVEYSGMKFALFFLGEYVNSLAVSIMFAVLFLGGYAGPVLPPYLWLLAKVGLVFAVLMWLRGTLPRVRVDQLMSLNWKFLVPLSVTNIIVVMVLAKLFVASPALAAANGGIVVAPVVQALILFLANVGLLLAALLLVARNARAARLVEAEDLERRAAENRMATAH